MTKKENNDILPSNRMEMSSISAIIYLIYNIYACIHIRAFMSFVGWIKYHWLLVDAMGYTDESQWIHGSLPRNSFRPFASSALEFHSRWLGGRHQWSERASRPGQTWLVSLFDPWERPLGLHWWTPWSSLEFAANQSTQLSS